MPTLLKMPRFKRPSASETVHAIGDLSVVSPVERRAYSVSPSFTRLPSVPPRGSWLAEQEEKGQSFKSFARRSFRCSPHGHCDTLYIAPIGRFDSARSPSLDALVQYAAAYFGCKVGVLPVQPIKAVMENARQGEEGQLQLECGTIRDYLCKTMKQPRDSFGVLAITMEDLYPIKNGVAWNFVFGQASPMDGVGVFSFARYDPSGEFLSVASGDLAPMEPAEYQQLLRRCCRVLTHEGSHVIGLKHCIHFQCLMNGSNHLQESDAAPLHLCPLCLRKLAEGCSIGERVQQRYELLLQWYRDHGFDEDAAFIQTQLELIAMPPSEEEEAPVASTSAHGEARVCSSTRVNASGHQAPQPQNRVPRARPTRQPAKCPRITCRGKRGCVCPKAALAANATNHHDGGVIATLLS